MVETFGAIYSYVGHTYWEQLQNQIFKYFWYSKNWVFLIKSYLLKTK
jgi:hypothetical protein